MPRLELIHPDLEPAMDAWLRTRGHAWQQLERGEIAFGDRPLTSLDLQFLLVTGDPVFFVETFFVERDDVDGRPWRLFDYQKPSMRHRGNTVHECGAEVGKTREIVGLATWMLLGCAPRQRGDLLISASQDGHLDSIYDEILFQLRSTPYLEQQIDWAASRVKPYRKIVALNGNRLELRPAGYDGEAIRGLHVGLAGFLDEAAKLKNPRIFDEFFRALKPGAEGRLYSTPDGDRHSTFYRLCQQATEHRAAALNQPTAPSAPGAELPPSVPGLFPSSTGLGPHAIKFRWSKRLMPPPFWSAERRRKLIEQYGGVDSPGYQQLVEGNWGDPAASVFPWEQFAPRCRYVPEYVGASLLWNAAERSVHVEAWRLDPTFQIGARPGDEEGAARAAQPRLQILDRDLDAANFSLEGMLTSIFARLPGHLVAGVDCGATDDPTEILVWEVRGALTRCVARLQLKRFDYPQQRTAIRVLDQLLTPSHGWGLDATGVGSALEHLLREGEAGWSLDGRVTGFVFNARSVDRNPETGEEILEATGKARTVTYKELGTRLLEMALQRARIEFPADPDFLSQFPSHTASVGASGQRVFSRTGDHLVDASRTAHLRLFELQHGDAAPPIVYAIPRGTSRPRLSLEI